MKKFLMLSVAFLASFGAVVNAEGETKLTDLTGNGSKAIPYECGDKCGLKAGSTDSATSIKGIENNKPLSEYAQDIVAYILKFTYVVAVIYVIYAGFLILMAAGSDEKMWAAKNNIVYVMVGIIVIYLANSIVLWTINLVG